MLEHLAVGRLEKFNIDAFHLDVFYSIMCIVFNCIQLLFCHVYYWFCKTICCILKGTI